MDEVATPLEQDHSSLVSLTLNNSNTESNRNSNNDLLVKWSTCSF